MPDARDLAREALEAQMECDESEWGGYAWEHMGDMWRNFKALCEAALADDTADRLARAEADNARLRTALEQISGNARWYARFYTGGSDG